MKKFALLAFCVANTIAATSIAKPITVEHSLGTTRLEQKPQRVVAIGMGAVDTLDYFGITPIAVSKGIDYPVALQKYNAPQLPSSGSLFEPDLAAIEQLKPDLIVVGLRAAKHYQALTDIAPTLFFALDDERAYWSSTQQQWRNIGAIANSHLVEQISTKQGLGGSLT